MIAILSVPHAVAAPEAQEVPRVTLTWGKSAANQSTAPPEKSARASLRVHYSTDRTPPLAEQHTIHRAVDLLLPWHVVVRTRSLHRHSFFLSDRVFFILGYVTYPIRSLDVARLELLRRRWGVAHGQDGIDRG